MDHVLKNAIADIESILAAVPEHEPALAGFRGALADLKGKAEAGAGFDWRSLIPFLVIGLKADQAIVPDPTAKAVLAVVIYCLGKLAPAPPAS